MLQIGFQIGRFNVFLRVTGYGNPEPPEFPNMLHQLIAVPITSFEWLEFRFPLRGVSTQSHDVLDVLFADVVQELGDFLPGASDAGEMMGDFFSAGIPNFGNDL